MPPLGTEPVGDQESLVKGALYCIPVDSKGRSLVKGVPTVSLSTVKVSPPGYSAIKITGYPRNRENGENG